MIISRDFIEKHDRRLFVESEEGIGSTFSFTFPSNSVVEEKVPFKNVFTADVAMNQTKKLKILIVGDDDISEMLISIAVTTYKREVLKVRTGVEAVEVCLNNPDIDLVLMVIQLPIMDGYEAIKQIRQFNKDVIIFAEPAFGLKGNRNRAIEAGCNEYIAKPLNFSLFKELIQKYLIPSK